MNRFTPALAAALFCFSAATAFAQGPAGDPGKGPGMMGQGAGGPGGPRMMKPCSQESDPAKCEATRREFRDNLKQAHEACKDKPDRRACMTEQYCAKSADPAQCNAKAKERQSRMNQRMDERQAAAEACTGKRGDALRDCLREKMPRRGPGRDPAGAEKKG